MGMGTGAEAVWVVFLSEELKLLGAGTKRVSQLWVNVPFAPPSSDQPVRGVVEFPASIGKEKRIEIERADIFPMEGWDVKIAFEENREVKSQKTMAGHGAERGDETKARTAKVGAMEGVS